MMLAPTGMVLAQESAGEGEGKAAAAASEVPVTEDLAAVIALQGQPCGKVVSADQTGEDAYVATCQDGNRFRIFVNAEGRVVVAKLE
jgi:hypothetical protein